MLVTWNLFQKGSNFTISRKTLIISKQETFFIEAARVVDGMAMPPTLFCIKLYIKVMKE